MKWHDVALVLFTVQRPLVQQSLHHNGMLSITGYGPRYFNQDQHKYGKLTGMSSFAEFQAVLAFDDDW